MRVNRITSLEVPQKVDEFGESGDSDQGEMSTHVKYFFPSTRVTEQGKYTLLSLPLG